MRKQVLVALTVAATFFTACAQTSKTNRTKTRTRGNMPAVTSATMQRGACFGRCPEYKLTIKSDGTVTYQGTRNAPSLGTYQKNIGAEKATKVLNEFGHYRVDTLKDTYRQNIADMPGLAYTFVINGREKSVGNAGFGPTFLQSMAELMDSYGKVDGSWKKIADAKEEN